MQKILIQHGQTAYTVKSPDRDVIVQLEEELRQLGITGVSTSYGKTASLTVATNQGDEGAARDKEHWLWSSIDNLRPSGFYNWETAFLVEQLGFDEDAPSTPIALATYVRCRMAPQEFYELFEAEPKGDPHAIQWEEVARALRG